VVAAKVHRDLDQHDKALILLGQRWRVLLLKPNRRIAKRGKKKIKEQQRLDSHPQLKGRLTHRGIAGMPLWHNEQQI
jgi:hypothetical protein